MSGSYSRAAGTVQIVEQQFRFKTQNRVRYIAPMRKECETLKNAVASHSNSLVANELSDLALQHFEDR